MFLGDDQNPASTLSSGTSSSATERLLQLAGAGPSRAGPNKNSANANGSVSPHNYKENNKTDNNEIGSTELKPSVVHNISINVTDTDSPTCVRRRIHLRSLSDVTPASRTHTPRARSHSERPRASPAPSPSHAPQSPATVLAAPATAPAVLLPRIVRSERSSPDASSLALDDGTETRLRSRDRSGSDAVSVLGNPWRKMSDVDLNASGSRSRSTGRGALDPWVRNPTLRPDKNSDVPKSREDVTRAVSDSEQKRDVPTFKRGKLERRSPVVCETCGNESCECWRTGWARHARAARSLGAQCTCDGRSPRPSPARLRPRAPPRTLSDDEDRPRRLYKSASQKMICTSIDGDRVKKLADPLLETTC